MESVMEIEITESLASVFSSEIAWHYRSVPIRETDAGLVVLTDESFFFAGMQDELEMLLNTSVAIEKGNSQLITKYLEKQYPITHTDSRTQKNYYTGNPDDFLFHMLQEARDMKSSDIHLEPYEQFSRVRIRLDGNLVQRYLLEKDQYPALINKIKIIAHLDIAEKRLPQDGRILFEKDGNKIDIRVSIIPTLYGEKVVLRLLRNDATQIDLSTLGLNNSDMVNFLESIKKPNGIVLISGPTGSGKTTTLYATLKLLNQTSRNILTIEDPIEYTLEGINQVQLKESIGLTFSSALRTFLRQDPDVIMVGEIRDHETAEMAIRAALTGHLVLSTIHTNSAWGIVSRLIDMNIAPFLVANTLNAAISQRLIRILCPHCKSEHDFDKKLLPPKFTPPRLVQKHWLAKGCPECHNTGYKGRKAIFEVIRIDEELANCIKSGNQNTETIFRERSIKPLAENAFEEFELGSTSLEEIYPLLIN